MTDRLSIREAAKLAGRSTDTIYRWRADGCDVSDRRALLEYSEIQDIRSRGKAAKLAFDRVDAHEPKQVLEGGIRSYFPPVPDPARFYDIPSPIDSSLQERVTNLLETVQRLFSERQRDLRTIGHEQSVQMGEEELRYISEGRRLMEMVLNSFYD